MVQKLTCQNCGEEISALTEPGGIITCEVCGVENMILEIPEIPFEDFRVRSLLIWLAFGIFALLIMARALKGLNLDLLSEYLWFSAFHTILLVWIWRRFGRSKVSSKRVIGVVPDNYRLLPAVACVVPLMLFSIGAGQTAHYLTSLVSPS